MSRHHKAKNVLVFGSFDLLHKGHRYFLSRSRERGECLLAVLSRDEEIARFKKRRPAWDFTHRKAALLKSGLVDQVFRSDLQYGNFCVLQDMPQKPDLIVLGDGQEALGAALEEFFQTKEEYRCPIVHIAPHRRFLLSSTQLHRMRLALAYLALFGALLFWAFSWIIGKVVATSTLPAPLASALRMNLLGAFFLLWQLCHSALATSQKRNQTAQTLGSRFLQHCRKGLIIDRKNLGYLVLSGMFFTVYNLCFFYGLSALFASQGGILTSVLIPIFSILLYSLGQKARLCRTQIIGLILGLLSAFLLLGGPDWLLGYLGSTALNTSNTVWVFDHPGGIKIYWQSGLFFGTALAWSLITQLSSKIQETCSLGKYSFYTYFFASLWSSWGWFWYQGAIRWLPLLALVLVSSVLGTSLYFFALRFLRPHYVAGFLFLNPVFILLMSWLFLGEPWSIELSLGSILAVLTIIMLNGK